MNKFIRLTFMAVLLFVFISLGNSLDVFVKAEQVQDNPLGNLSIMKTVEGIETAELFDFELVLSPPEGSTLDTCVATCSNGIPATSTLVNEDGTATINFKLGDKDTIDIQNIPVGTLYTVEEIMPQDSPFTATYSVNGSLRSSDGAASGAVTNGTNTVRFVNIFIQVLTCDSEGERLAGASVELLELKIAWTSTTEPYIIRGLDVGTYTLHVNKAPEGYVIPADTTFTINDDGTVTSEALNDGYIEIKFAKINSATGVLISTVDAITMSKLGNAKMQVIDPDGNVAEEWDSTADVKEIEGLETGVQYTLRATVAPDGYVIPEDITFTIDETGKVTSTGTTADDGTLLVQFEKTKISISTTDISTDETIEGAKMQVIDSEGNVVEEWISTVDVKEIEGLETGVEYTLRATVAPDGYIIPADTTFTIDEKGEVTYSGATAEDGTLLVQFQAVGSLTVSNAVESVLKADKEKGFEFTITLSDESINGTYGEAIFKDGVAVFTLKDGESCTITDLPVGLGYDVSQIPVENFNTSSEGATGTISNTATEAAFTNTGAYQLQISNAVQFNLDLDANSLIRTSNKDKGFSYELSIKSSEGSEDSEYEGNFVLKDKECKTIYLSDALYYEITQEDYTNDMFITKIGSEEGLSTKGTLGTQPVSVAYTNMRADVAVKCNVADTWAKLGDGRGYGIENVPTLKYTKEKNLYLFDSLDLVETSTEVNYSIGVISVPYGYKEVKSVYYFKVDKYGNLYLNRSTEPSADANGNQVIDVTPIKANTATLTIQNYIYGDSAETDKEFTFTVEIENGPTENFVLKHNASKNIDVVEGSIVTVEQTAEPFYTTKYKLSDNPYSEAGTTIEEFEIKSDAEYKIVFTNTAKKVNIAAVDSADNAVKLSNVGLKLDDENIKLDNNGTYQIEMLALDPVVGTHTISVYEAPEGYIKPSDVNFTINEDGTITQDEEKNIVTDEAADVKILFNKTKVAIKAVDDNSSALDNVEMAIMQKKGEDYIETYSWSSSGATEEIEALLVNETYVVIAECSGYVMDLVPEFIIKEDGTVVLNGTQISDISIDVTLAKVVATVTIKAVDIDTNKNIHSLAKWQMFRNDAKYGEILELGGTSQAEDIEFAKGQYKLQQLECPDNYKVVNESIEFSIDANGNVTDFAGEPIADNIILLKYQSDTPEESSSSSSLSPQEPTDSNDEASAYIDESSTQINEASENATETQTGQNNIVCLYFSVIALLSVVFAVKLNSVNKRRKQ